MLTASQAYVSLWFVVVTALLLSQIQTVIMGQELRASIVFSSMTVFDVLREQLSVGFLMLNLIVTGKVSLDRIDDFLKNVCFVPWWSRRFLLSYFRNYFVDRAA